ncbi:MAG: PIN domain-containing protein [Nanobdellota archaeon]
MSRKKKQAQIRKNITQHQTLYYDACTFESEDTQIEIINNKHQYSVTSHLSLGEAYGNCIKKDQEAVSALVEYIEKLGDKLIIVGNDHIEKEIEEIKRSISRISVTDTIHLATAIKNKSCSLRTLDRDLNGLPKKKVKTLAEKFGIENFSISKVPSKKKKSSQYP